jgi:RimJ/RimL family protein N-acetyltransferase
VNEFSLQPLRLLILTWNERLRKVAEALGFQEKQIVPSNEGEFRVMVRPSRDGTAPDQLFL